MTDAQAASPWSSFRRHLTPEALAAFEQRLLHDLLAIFRDAARRCPTINIYFRGDTIDVYEGGSRIAGLTPGTGRRRATLTVADAYLDATPWARTTAADPATPDEGRLKTTPARAIPIDDHLVEAWRTHIDRVIATSRAVHTNPEGRWEARVLAANQAGTPVEFLDRQVQVPRRHARVGPARRLDALGLATVDGRDALVAVELKQKEDPRIGELYDQMAGYLAMLGGPRHVLRHDIAMSYRRVATQRMQLGLPSVAPDRVQPDMPLYGLVVLADYNPNSTRLAAAVTHAARREAEGGAPIYAHVLAGDDCVLPGWPWISLSRYPIAESAKRRLARRRSGPGDGGRDVTPPAS